MSFRPPGGDGAAPIWRALVFRNFRSSPADASYACRAAMALLLFAASTAKATTYTWTGDGGNVSWSTAGNWGGSAPVSGSSTDLVFAGTNNTGTAATPLNNPTNPFVLNSLSFAAGAGSFFLGGGDLRFNGASNLITQNSSNSQSITNTFGPNAGLVTIGLTGDGTGAVTLSGAILRGNASRDYAITKTGTSTFILAGANTYEGATTISAGVLNVRNASGLGSTIGATTVANGAALQLQGGIAIGTEALTLDGSGIGQTGALRNISGDNSFAGTINLASAATIGSDAGNLRLTGAISGTSGLTKVGAGTLTLSGSNTFSGGLTVQNGTLSFGTPSLGDASNVIMLGGSSTTGTLQYTGAGGTSSRTFTMAGSGTGAFDITTATATLTLSGSIGGSGALVKTGAGTLALNGASTYTGPTSVNAGTVSQGAGASLASTILNVSSGATFTGNATATLPATLAVTAHGNVNFHAAANTISSLDGNSSGRVTLNSTSLTVSSGSYDGVIQNGASAGALTKSGTGTLTLNGANTFSGSTTINGGTLVAAATSGSALGSTSGVVVNSGGTLLLAQNDQINNAASLTLAGGTFSKGDFSEGATNAAGVGALTLTAAGSRLDFGSGTVGTLSFASLSTSGFALTIDNWTGTANAIGSGTADRLIFASDQTANLSSFSFTGYQDGATQFSLGGGYYEVTPMTPVPEPSTYAAAALALLAVGWQQRRRLRALVRR